MAVIITRGVALAGCAVMLAGAVLFAMLASTRRHGLEDAHAIARRPADRQLLSRIAESALEREDRAAEPLWRASAAALRVIAPEWRNGKIRVVRSGLFHWPQLSDEGRRLLLAESKLLLSHPHSFEELALPIYRLTGNIDFILANAPATPQAYLRVRQLALSARRFDDYRVLREKEAIEFRRILERLIEEKAGGEVVFQSLLSITPRENTKQIIGSYLELLESNPPASASGKHAELERLFLWMRRGGSDRFDPLVTVASLDPSIPETLRARILLAGGEGSEATRLETTAGATRSAEWSQFHLDELEQALNRGNVAAARAQLAELPLAERESLRALRLREKIAQASKEGELARALATERLEKYGPPPSGRWLGLCDRNVFCSDRIVAQVSTDGPAGVELRLASDASDSAPAYIEITSNGEIVAEGAVKEAMSFVLPLAAGDHHLEIRVTNPRTGTGARRRVTLL
jgi:hypothetical protein